ncbi:MAG: phosphate ABC transporter permease PstA [Bacteroidetes bacterium]|nr:phosphate ABC transporter permease PstA [Bacteroidota bacterium]
MNAPEKKIALSDLFKAASARKRRQQQVAFALLRAMSVLVALLLLLIVGYITIKGAPALSWEFLTASPKNGMTEGGIFPAIVGTLCLAAGSMLFAFPVGVMAGIYLSEYVSNGPLKQFIRIMTSNLAGVPSVVFGLFGMSMFVNGLGFGSSILAGSLTLAVMVLPVVIRTTEEALKAVAPAHRMGSYALGATRWQTTRRVVLPQAMPGILTGFVLAVGRVSGETAPILFTAAAYFLTRLPESIFDQVMALPYHLYVLATSGNDIEKSQPAAFGTALILILLVLLMNMLTGLLRNRLNRKAGEKI